jgi:hypothetical protein
MNSADRNRIKEDLLKNKSKIKEDAKKIEQALQRKGPVNPRKS